MTEFEKYSDTCVRGFYTYQDVWRPVIEEELARLREEQNPRDPYAVAVMKPCVGVVGHVPRYLLTLCSIFMRHYGGI